MEGLKAPVQRWFPRLYAFAHRIWHWLRAKIEGQVLRSKVPELIWRARGKAWAKTELQVTDHVHRKQLVAAINSYSPLHRVLEVGCNAAPNLMLLAQQYPLVQLVGVDISPGAIRLGKRNLQNAGHSETQLLVGRADRLDRFEQNSFDVVFTDAVLMFVGGDKIRNVIRQMARVARNGIVLNEYHSDRPPAGNYLGARWVYDYRQLVDECLPGSKCEIVKSEFTRGDWDRFGSLIKIVLAK